MKIAHVTATFPPYWAGTGNVAYHNARVIHERGHEVTVFTAAPVDKEPMAFPFDVKYLPSIFRIGNAPVTPELVHQLVGFDLVHLHYPYIFGGELVTWAQKKHRAPFVVTYHNDLLSPGLKGVAFKAYSKINQRWVLSHADQLIATSVDYAQHSLLQSSLKNRNVMEIPNGVDIHKFVPSSFRDSTFQTRYGLADDRPTVLFVGAMDQAHFFKGVPVLLDAVKRHPEMQAVLVGEGDLRKTFEQSIAEHDRDRFRFVGSVPLDDLIRFYQSSDVTVLPSLTMGEAFGIVLIESLACGTPVIASNLPGVRTVIDEGVNGFLFPPGDAEALASRLNQLLYGTDRERFGRAGRKKVEQKYAWELVGNHLEQLYKEVVGR